MRPTECRGLARATLAGRAGLKVVVIGGPMSPEECAAFRNLPFAEEALRLRRYDDAAKDPNRQTRSFHDIITACQLSDESP